MGDNADKPGRASRTRRFLLAYLLVIGIPAALEFGSAIEIRRETSPSSAAWYFGGAVPATSLAPAMFDYKSSILAANGTVGPVTLMQTSEPVGMPVPLPDASFDLSFELHQLDGSGGVLARWTAGHEMKDVGEMSLSLPWVSARVSLSRIAGGELPPGRYRLYVDVREVSGPNAGKRSSAVYEYGIIAPPQTPYPDPPNHMPGVLRLEFDHFEPGTAGWVAVLRARNVSPWTLMFAGRKAGAPPPSAPLTAAEGERFLVSYASGSLWGSTDPANPPRWSQMGTANSIGEMVNLPPGVGIELAGIWEEHGFGVRAAQVLMSGEGQTAWIASDPFEVLLDDSTTTGPVVLWYAGVAGSLPRITGRRIENWRGVDDAP